MMEGLCGLRVRDAVGDFALAPPEQRPHGPGASRVMAPFTRLNRRNGRKAARDFDYAEDQRIELDARA